MAHAEPGPSMSPPEPTHAAKRAAGPPATGTVIEVRGEEWLVRGSEPLRPGEFAIDVTGVSDLVRNQQARFVTTLDEPRVLSPEDTVLEHDDSVGYRRGRLFLEAVLRKTPLPQTESRLALADGFLLDRMDYQLRPAEMALANPLSPRLLIGDVVGLGKTLEIGVLLGELVRRGRGERILVVTPAPVLEQFQHEMWTRFSLPLVRLDSAGIARIERKIPAGRNPFTHFQRVIISMDTLKNPKRYKPWLEHLHWDAVVIDESHNLISRSSERRALADLLAAHTDALILASATPHNGDMSSFTGLVRLLDPMAVKDPRSPTAQELAHLFIRRTKASGEVAEALGQTSWAPRGDSRPVSCTANELEEQVFCELARHWLNGPATGGRGAGAARGDERLFPYVLLKSFLSSHRALFATVRERLTKLGHRVPDGHRSVADPASPQETDPPGEPQVDSLLRLATLARAIQAAIDRDGPSAASKLQALVGELKSIGLGAGRDVRAVVFSERRETLDWLREVVPALLGFTTQEAAKAAVKVLYSGVPDTMQMEIVDEFARAGSNVRLLLTGDGASEGVNLHRQCHHLIHWDLPWSLIRVEQRNGRIDRYGQRDSPEFRALILRSHTEDALDDTTIAEKILAREAAVHQVYGAVEASTKENDADREEVRVMRALFTGAAPQAAVWDLEVPGAAEHASEASETSERPIEQRLYGEFAESAPAAAPDTDAEPDFGDFDMGFDLDDLGADADTDADRAPDDAPQASAADLPAALATVEELRLFAHPEDPTRLESSRRDFVLTGLQELRELESFRLKTRIDGDDLSFEPPSDLVDRLDVLPASYLRAQKIAQRMNLTFSRVDAADSLKRAREDVNSSSLWPDAHYVGELHPVIEWITDKALMQLGRQRAPILQVDRRRVPHPVFLTQGVWSNAEGRPTVVAWLAVDGLDDGEEPRARTLTPRLLEELGLGPDMPDHHTPGDVEDLQRLVPRAVARTRQELSGLRDVAHQRVDEPLRAYERQVDDWQQQLLPGFTRSTRDEAADRLRERAERLKTAGEPMVRILAALEPGA